VVRRRTVVATFRAAVFTGAFFAAAAVLGTGFPMLDRYFFFFDFVEGAVVFVGAATVAPRHTPTATSAVSPTLVNEIILERLSAQKPCLIVAVYNRYIHPAVRCKEVLPQS
jgi:hypothetical protein